MDDDVTRFTAIKGIGKRTDARLHEAGVATWHSLAEVLMALSTIREASSERLGDMGRQAASGPPAPETVRPRRHVTSRGRTASSSRSPSTPLEEHRPERHRRSSGAGAAMGGWEPAFLISFIEQRTGLDGSPPTAPARPARAVRSRRPAA